MGKGHWVTDICLNFNWTLNLRLTWLLSCCVQSFCCFRRHSRCIVGKTRDFPILKKEKRGRKKEKRNYFGVFWFLHIRVPGEIKRRKVELGPQVSPEEIMSREVELGCESWTSFASGCSWTAVQRTLSLWLCPARQLKQQLRRALVAGQWRGDTALTFPLFWRRSTISPVFFEWYLRSSLHSLALPPPPSPFLISNLASVDVKQHGQGQGCFDDSSMWKESRTEGLVSKSGLGAMP